MKSAAAFTTAFVAVALASSVARAAPPNNPAEARFNEAMELAKAGRYAEACPKLEESQRLDPALGTQFNLADCYERTDRLARAWRLFNAVADGARQVGKAERAKAALERAQALEQHMPRLRIRAPSDGTTVDRDGERVPVSELGQAIPVDPGNHTIEAHSGDKSWRTEVSAVEAAKTIDVEVPTLTAAPAPVVAPPPAPTPTIEASTEKPIPPRPSPLRTIGLIAGGVGVVGIGIGTFFAFRASSKNDDSNAAGHCDATGCDARGKSARNDALDAAAVSTVTFIAGAALLAGGVALFLFTPSTKVAVGPGNLVLRGTW